MIPALDSPALDYLAFKIETQTVDKYMSYFVAVTNCVVRVST